MFSSIADFLRALDQAAPVPREFVPLPALGEGKGIWLRGMTAAEWDEFQQRRHKQEGPADLANYRAGVVAYALCDEAGNRLSTDPQADAAEIGRCFAPVIRQLYAVADRLNKFDVEAAEKN